MHRAAPPRVPFFVLLLVIEIVSFRQVHEDEQAA